jgi:hypothetical protein
VAIKPAAMQSHAIARTTMITTARIGCTECPEAPHTPPKTLPLCKALDQVIKDLSALHQETISDPHRTLMHGAASGRTVL